MKEQIEEMANDLENYACMSQFQAEIASKMLYAKSYRKQSEGEWQEASDGTHWCSKCGHDATYTFDGTEICGVACPFCGAKMRGVTDGKE